MRHVIAILLLAGLFFLAPVARRERSCSDVTPQEQWKAYGRLLGKVNRGYFTYRRFLAFNLVIDLLLLLLLAIFIMLSEVRPGPVVIAIMIVTIVMAVAILSLILLPPLSALLGILLADQADWPHIERCLIYLEEDPDLSDQCKLDAIRDFSESAISSNWGAVAILGILFTFGGTFLVPDTLKQLSPDWQPIVAVGTVVAGFATFMAALSANGNTVIFRAITLWQRNPVQARRAAAAARARRR
jgi:hypothetical protein